MTVAISRLRLLGDGIPRPSSRRACDHPDVFAALLAFLALPGAAAFAPEAVVRFVSSREEMPRWLEDADAERALAAAPEIAATANAIRLPAALASPQ